ncbi:MAG: hypothetical protein ACLVDJ_15805 [Eggerthella lenta]
MFLKMLGNDLHYRSVKVEDGKPTATVEDLYLAPWADGEAPLTYTQTVVQMEEVGEDGEVVKPEGVVSRRRLDVSDAGVYDALAVVRVDEINVSKSAILKLAGEDDGKKGSRDGLEDGLAAIAGLLTSINEKLG